MRCAYCHNPQIVRAKGTLGMDDVLDFLRRRQNLLDGVVLSGGEATLYPELEEFTAQVKTMGYAVKLDTNGTRPETVRRLAEENLIDCVALDYKAPAHNYKNVTGTTKFEAFQKTLAFLCKQNTLPFEVRTTVHTELLDEDDLSEIVKDLDRNGFHGTYYIQNYIANDQKTLKPLSKRPRMLDKSRIAPSESFKIAFRNFDGQAA